MGSGTCPSLAGDAPPNCPHPQMSREGCVPDWDEGSAAGRSGGSSPNYAPTWASSSPPGVHSIPTMALTWAGDPLPTKKS